MCSSSPAIFAAIFAIATTAVVAEPTAVTEARNPFTFEPGGRPAADEKVWSAVVLASNAKKGTKPTAPPAELAPFAAKLSKFFGYDQFEILGSATKVMDEQNERWLVPTQNFWLCARATRERGSYRLKMEFFHDTRRILQTEAKVGPKSPLFIRGPVHPRGQLILVFEVRP
jgi:hypothetical protein